MDYVDAQSYWKNNGYFPGSMVDGVHLSNMGHALVSELLEGSVVKLISGLRAAPAD
jgi:lysophospholipase L1-like esterase